MTTRTSATKRGNLEMEIGMASARLEVLREEMRNTPVCLRQSTAFLSRAAERQKLLGRLDALRRLASLS